MPDEPRVRWSRRSRWALALLIFSVALALRFLLLPVQAGLAFLTFYPAVVLAFYLCGLPQGWLVVALGAAVGNTVFTPPHWAISLNQTGLSSVLVFVVSSALIHAIVNQLQHRSAQLREALARLGQTEARYRNILEQQTDVIAHFQADGTVAYVNAALCRLFGVAAERTVGSRWQLPVAPADAAQRLALLQTLSPSQPVVTLEARVIAHDGTLHWGQCIHSAQFDANGKLQHNQLVWRDISQRKTLEQHLAAHAAELSDLYDNAPCGYYSLDPDGKFLRINDTALGWLGCDRDTLIGRLGPVDFFNAEGRAVFEHSFSAFKASGRQDGLTFALHSRDGSTRQVSLSATAVRDVQGQFLRSRSVLYDVTELRQTQLQLQQASNEQQAMLDNDLIGMVKLRDRRAVWANRGMARIFGYPLAQLQGAPSRLLYPDEATYQAFGAAGDQDLRAGRTHRSQVRMQRQDGTPLWIDASGVALSAGSGESLWLLADITAITDAQVAMALARDRAEDATRAKSAFLANMSHEIRTPMNAIIGLTHLMSRDTQDTLERERLDKIADAARHLLQVINDILDLSKIEAGKMTLEDTEFSLDGMLAGVFEMVNERARGKGLELVLDTDHLPARLRGDPTRLAQALINLLANAVKFTRSGWVRLRGQLLREERDMFQVRFEVQDTGEGVAASRQAALFNAFEQGDTSTTRRHGGTGLGLALVRHLARLMGGEVGMESKPGQGSTFWFTAWLGRAEQAGDRAVPVSLQGLRALLVDDLPEALQALADRLQLLGLQVDAQPSGAAALQRVTSEIHAGRAFDVLLIDWRMAPMDGIETLQRLRSLLGAGTPPAILATAFDETAMWHQARIAQVDAVLVKPITASALHDTLSRLLRKQVGLLLSVPLPIGQAEADLQRHHAGQRVLLAEDNPVNQEVGRELLRRAGLVVDTADNGRRAVELALTRGYDLVLMDMQMPELDGLAATREIRARAGQGLPIIAMTANAFGEDRQACLDAGMNDHVAKPVRPDHLYATLRRWLPLRDGRGGAAPPAGSVAVAIPLLDRLAAVPGLDVQLALDRLGGQEDALARVLARFVQTYQTGEPGLLPADGVEPLLRWRAVCHALRSACGSVGASALEHGLADFEARLGGATPVAELASLALALHTDLQALASSLARALAG